MASLEPEGAIVVSISEKADVGDYSATDYDTVAAGSSNQLGGRSMVQEGRDTASLEPEGARVMSASETAVGGDSLENVFGTAAAGSSNQLSGNSVMPGLDVVFFSKVEDFCATGA